MAVPTDDAPVRQKDRLIMLDALRGIAVITIFIVNIKAMAGPLQAYMNPSYWTGPADRPLFMLTSWLVEFKFYTIFCALFGAGLALLADRADAAGVKNRLGARLFWLAVIGAAHGFLIWIGDVLLLYAVIGFIAAWLIRRRAKTLFIIGGVLLTLGWIHQLTAVLAPPSDESWRLQKLLVWDVQGERARMTSDAYLGGVIAQLQFRLKDFTVAFALGVSILPRALGLMLIGAALLKSGFLKGAWSPRAYGVTALIALAGGLGPEGMRVIALQSGGWSLADTMFWSGFIQYPASLMAALGYAAAIGWAVKRGAAFSRLAAVGRMSLSNYLASSLIGTTIFYGHGLGLHGSTSLAVALCVVAASALAMLLWSSFWLDRFRYGPVEWLWRSLSDRSHTALRRAGHHPA